MNYDEDECVRCQGNGVYFARHNVHNSDLYDNRHTMCGGLVFKELEIPTVDHQAGTIDFCSCAHGREQKFKYDHERRKTKKSYSFFAPFGDIERYAAGQGRVGQVRVSGFCVQVRQGVSGV